MGKAGNAVPAAPRLAAVRRPVFPRTYINGHSFVRSADNTGVRVVSRHGTPISPKRFFAAATFPVPLGRIRARIQLRVRLPIRLAAHPGQ